MQRDGDTPELIRKVIDSTSQVAKVDSVWLPIVGSKMPKNRSSILYREVEGSYAIGRIRRNHYPGEDKVDFVRTDANYPINGGEQVGRRCVRRVVRRDIDDMPPRTAVTHSAKMRMSKSGMGAFRKLIYKYFRTIVITSKVSSPWMSVSSEGSKPTHRGSSRFRPNRVGPLTKAKVGMAYLRKLICELSPDFAQP